MWVDPKERVHCRHYRGKIEASIGPLGDAGLIEGPVEFPDVPRSPFLKARGPVLTE